MNIISTVSVKGTDIDFLLQGKKLGYTITHGDRQYGQSITLESRKTLDIIQAVALLIINALETKEELDKA